MPRHNRYSAWSNDDIERTIAADTRRKRDVQEEYDRLTAGLAAMRDELQERSLERLKTGTVATA